MSASSLLAVAVALAGTVALASSCAPEVVGTKATDAGTMPVAEDASGPQRPFDAQPDESEGLINVSADLDALLQRAAISGACDRYRAGSTSRQDLLLCGKWMFFYETFGTQGIPAGLVKFLASRFPDELGLGFEKLGMIRDPSSSDDLPLGLAPSAKLGGKIDSLAFTCASCHFGKLPDGRYAVGAPNHAYEYGTHILDLTIAAGLGMGTSQEADHHPAAVYKVKPVVDRLKNDAGLRSALGLELLPLLGQPQPELGRTVEAQYASWPSGTMDFVIAPIGIDDGVHVVSKISALWGIPHDAEVASTGMQHALLGWAGSASSLTEFVGGFAMLGGRSAPADEVTRPLVEYVYSLRAPANPSPPAADAVLQGETLFETKGCIGCHGGPRGSGLRAYTFDEIGTDRALQRWADPDQTGTACCGLAGKPGSLTHGVKSPRLVGEWAFGRVLHNGALANLEQLFCLEARPESTEEPMGSQGHTFTCDGLADDEKRALIAFLRAQ